MGRRKNTWLVVKNTSHVFLKIQGTYFKNMCLIFLTFQTAVKTTTYKNVIKSA